jgi:hypothetical protein
MDERIPFAMMWIVDTDLISNIFLPEIKGNKVITA